MITEIPAATTSPPPLPGEPCIPGLSSLQHTAGLAFLQHGDLPDMASTLLQAAGDILDVEGGLIFDLDREGQPQLLAASGSGWDLGFDPSPRISANWKDGFPQPCWNLPVSRGETLHLGLDGSDPQGLRRQFPAGIQTLLALPLQAEGVAIGAIFLFNRSTGFEPAIWADIEALGHTLALGIASIRGRQACRKAEEELRQAQKMEALGQLAAGVAHDFNNMLTVINGYASLVRKDLPESLPAHQDLGIVLEAGQKAADLARQLLAFSRRQMLQPQVLDLNSRIDALQKMLRRLIRENICFEISLGERVPYIKADPGQIEQVLMNLAINASDAMPEGGTLTISSGHKSFDRRFILEHRGARTGDYAWFSVEDTGSGIPPQDKAKIFQPFFTTKEKGKGTGLGLATVYGIVKQSGGYITLESSPGHGTRFTVYLPKTNEGPTLEESSPVEPGLCRSGKLLLVEDDAEVLKFATKALLSNGFQVVSASDVELAEELFQCHRKEIHLLVTDMVMPTLSGPLLARNLRRQNPGLPVLFLSGYGQVTFHNDFLDGEEGAFLAKPFTATGLVDKISEILSGTKQAGQSVA